MHIKHTNDECDINVIWLRMKCACYQAKNATSGGRMGVSPYTLGVTDPVFAKMVQGASFTAALASHVNQKVATGGVAYDLFDKYQKTTTDVKELHKKEKQNYDVLADALKEQFRSDKLMEATQKSKDFMAAITQNNTGLQAKKQKDAYKAYGADSYVKYDKSLERKKEKEGIKQDYKVDFNNGRKGIDYGANRLEQQAETVEYKGEFNLRREAKEIKPYQTLEAVAYAVAAEQHAYGALLDGGNAQHYLLRKGDASVSASEGYVSSLDLRYLNIKVDKDGEGWAYQLLMKGAGEREVEFDKGLAAELERLLESISKKKELRDEDVLDSLIKILENRKKGDFDLEVMQKELEVTRQRLRKSKFRDKFSNLVLLLEKEELSMKKSVTKIVLGKGAGNDYDGALLDNLSLAANLLNSEPLTNESIIRNQIKSIKDNQRYHGSYTLADRDYSNEIESKKRDFTHNVPMKSVTKFPLSLMGGVLGFTYLGENFMGLRDDLHGEVANEVEVHEAIHTPDEYETRVITKWMLEDQGTHYH